ncbi:MAG: adenosylmethionine--8-amino-7-oxononanoate aminotransferase BioA [Rhodothalassiaceae bacterium]|nr:MAG: adenosylmethionine--8-amino-7-oxononanoate aminotransferase BioA [Rhodothalassiaceae bacterium]
MAATGGGHPDWYEAALRHCWRPYTQMKTAPAPLPVVATRGSRIVLADGRELVDGIASWWTAAHGYNHPHIVAAMKRQLDRMPHVMFGGLTHEPAARLAERLAAVTPGDLAHVFFAESGSVAVEVAIKMARQYWLNRGERRPKLLFFRGAYHGDTFAAMAVSDPEEGMHRLFRGMLEEHLLTELPTDPEREAALDRLLEAHRRELAAVIVEPLVQGAAGMRMHDAQTLRRIRAACDRHGLLMIADEIFTGFGRTGTLFACEQAGIVPDIMTVSKALTGGHAPLSAAIARPHVFAAFLDEDPEKALMHGPTYMAHAVGAAAALASLELFAREDRLAQARAIAAALRDGLAGLADLPQVREVRVLGAIAAVEIAPGWPFDRHAVGRRFVELGVWVRPLERVIYLTPALTIPEDDLARLVAAVRQVVGEL